MKKILRVTIFAVAITALLLMAVTMNFVSAESKAKVKLNLSEHHIEGLNHSEPATSPAKLVYNDLGYDDDTVEYVIAGPAGSGFAVKFTPLSYPADLRTARFCIPPEWPDPDHEMIAIYVYDDDGPGGQPGTCLGGPVHHTATNWYWNDVDISGLGIRIESGEFYILYQQLTDYPNCEGLCLDVGPPLYGQSWYWDYLSGWCTFPDYNCMIRCVLDNPAVESSWTFMVYLDGDNNLEWAAIDDFMEMSSVGSTPALNIVAQFDRGGYDSSYDGWTTCKRYFVTPGMTPTVANAINDLGECNMADPNTLNGFVTWAMATYPADKYALILWNHGSGWKKFAPWDEQTGRGVCWDNSHPGDYLTLQETEQALTGKYVHLLGYDACLMHMVEVVYQVRANAGVSVGSEEVEPNDGWPYDTILTDLAGAPTMTEYVLGTVIVDRYMGSYGYTRSETQSAVTNALLPGLVTAVDNLAQALMTEINAGHVAGVQQARNAAAEMIWDHDYVDLYHFAEMVKSYVPGAATPAQAVMNEVSKIYEAHGTSVPKDHGLSIYYPRNGGDYLASYDTTAFASNTHWNEYLMKYYYPFAAGPEDIAVYRNGWWFVSKEDHTGTDWTKTFKYGIAGDKPVIGDIDNNGIEDAVIYRNGWWYVSNAAHTGTDWTKTFKYGIAGDKPVIGDIDNNGIEDAVIYRNGWWFVSKEDHTGTDWTKTFKYGVAGDKPVIGDIDNDGIVDAVIYRNGWWYVSNVAHTSTDWTKTFKYGVAGDKPVIGDIG
jgi:hypothetical protein